MAAKSLGMLDPIKDRVLLESVISLKNGALDFSLIQTWTEAWKCE